MENEEVHKWFKKKRYIIPLSAVGLFTAIGIASSPTPTPQVQSQTGIQQTIPVQASTTLEQSLPVVQEQAETKVVTPEVQAVPRATPTQSKPLSNDNYYQNVDGNQVHSPAYTSDNSVPAGASAQCRDGTHSFSQNRRGTCSHHGGVAQWY